MQPKRTIYIRIRDLRRERDLTQEELAEALGVSRQSINAMEAGRCLPSLPVALQIASFFAIPLNQLIEMADEMSRLQEAQVGAQLMPWNPVQDMRELLEETSSSHPPHINIRLENDKIIAEAVLPGFAKKDISIEVGADFLTISGESTTSDNGTLVRQEFVQHSFSRTISLPTEVQSESAVAEMENGILRITLEKLEQPKPKTTRLEIN